MKWPKAKRKLTTEDICREYYESQIFRPTVDDEASPTYFFADVSIYLEAIDASLKEVDIVTFSKEMVAINFKLFGLAWLNHNYEPNKKLPMSGSFFTKEIAFTKQYIQDTGRGDIWGIMGFYNHVLAETIAEQTISKSWGRLRDIPMAIRDEDYEEVHEMFLIEKTKLLEDIFNKYLTDSECRDRLLYRFLAIPCDISRITLLSQKLSLTMMKRLGCNLKQVGLFALQRVVVGLYDNAVNYLDTVSEYGSYEAAKDTRRALLQGLKRVV